ncbi:MAG: GC-type dockerin domain-anchored protein [Phycisphaerales bacterium]
MNHHFIFIPAGALVLFNPLSHGSDPVPVRGSIESTSEIRLLGVNDEQSSTVVDALADSFKDLESISEVTIDSREGVYSATTRSSAQFAGAGSGSFEAVGTYLGNPSNISVATGFTHALSAVLEYDFATTTPSILDVSGVLRNRGASSISYFGSVLVFVESEAGEGFDIVLSESQVFDFGMDDELFGFQVPLEADSELNNYRVQIRFGHSGTTVITPQQSIGSIQADWSITSTVQCPADLSQDGVLNFFDVSSFINGFINRTSQGDFFPDGQYNFLDVSAFLSSYINGCP